MKSSPPAAGPPAGTTPRRWRLPVPAVLALAMLVLLAAAAALGETLGWPWLRAPTERALTRALARPVVLGPGFRIRLLGSIRLKADQLTMAPPPWDAQATGASPFFDARDIVLELPYSTLWTWYRRPEVPLHLQRLEIGELRARLHRRADGRANWDLRPDRRAPGDPPAPVAAFPIPTFDRLLLRSGHVSVDDAVTALQLDVQARTSEGPSGAPAAGGATATPDPVGLRLQGSGSLQRRPVDFELQSDSLLPLLAPPNGAASATLKLRARADRSRVTFVGTAADVLHLSGIDGEYEVSGPSLAAAGDAVGVTLPTTAAFSMAGRLKKDGPVFSTDVHSLSVGKSRLAGRFRFDTASTPPMLTGEVSGPLLALADLGPAIGTVPHAGAEAAPHPAGKVLPQREFDIPSLQVMNAEVRVRLLQADLGTPLLQPFAPLEVDVSLRNGVLRLDHLNASTSGGAVHGSLQLDSTTALPAFGADIQWSGIRLEQWMKLGNPHDTQARNGTSAPPYITGHVVGKARLSGRGRSTAAIVGSLDGQVSMGVRQGTLSHLVVEAAGLDLAQALGLLVKGDDALPMGCAVLQLASKAGQVQLQAGILDTPDSLLLLSGELSLVQETLALQLTVKPKDISPFTLRAPLNVAGTFLRPTVRPQAKTLSLKLLAAAVLGAVNPLAALIPFIDIGEKDTAPGCAGLATQARLRP